MDDLLAMGRELHDARLTAYVETSLHVPAHQPQSAMHARELIVRSSRHAAGLHPKEQGKPDIQLLEKAVDQIRETGTWLYVRDELGKMWREIEAEVSSRLPYSLAHDRDQSDKPPVPLTPTDELVLSIIREQPPGIGVFAKNIVEEMAERDVEYAESSLRKHVLPKLMKHCGVINHRAAGGYLIPQPRAT
ncbi:MAG TPA: hypothetical protein VGJ05_02030 [Fimbriiglobus sp.]|jgi:hypothetical protein